MFHGYIRCLLLWLSHYVVTSSCNPLDCSPPGSSVHGISQARILEWVPISFSRGSSWPRDQTCISCIAGGFFTTEPTRKPYKGVNMRENWVRVYRNSALFLQLFHKLKIVYLKICPHNHVGLSLWLSSKQSTCNAGNTGLIPVSGRSPGAGYGNPLRYSFLENSTDRRAWWATVHRVAKSWTWLKWLSMYAHIYMYYNTYITIYVHIRLDINRQADI